MNREYCAAGLISINLIETNLGARVQNIELTSFDRSQVQFLENEILDQDPHSKGGEQKRLRY